MNDFVLKHLRAWVESNFGPLEQDAAYAILASEGADYIDMGWPRAAEALDVYARAAAAAA